MKFTSIELLNWGPYEDTGEIDLTSSYNYPLVIFYGENGRGKTSLFDAFWFVLYGNEGFDSRAKKFQSGSYANWFRLKENEEFPVKVTLRYESQNKKVKLIRGFSAQPVDIAKKTVKISKPYVLMTINDNPINEGMIETVIRSELPKEISDFFLFDSEQLDSMLNNLSADDSTARQIIRDGIEKILGVPALQKLSKILQNESIKIEKIARKSDQAEKINKLAEEECRRLDVLIESAKKDKILHENTKSSLRLKIENMNEKLRNSEKIRQEVGRLEQLEKDEIQKKNDLESQIQLMQANLTDAWMLPLHKLIKEKNEVANDIIEKKDKLIKEIEKIKIMVENLETQIRSRICSGCNRAIEIDEADLQNKINNLNKDLDILKEENKNLNLLGSRVWSSLQNEGYYKLITENDRSIKKEKHRLAIIQGDIDDINNKLKTHDITEIRLLGQEKDQYLRDLTNIEHRINEIDKKLLDLNLKRDYNVKQIVKTANLDPALKLKLEFLNTLREVIDKTIPRFTSSVRQKVESVVSENYVNLLNNDDVSGLEISEDYQVWVVNKKIGRKRAVNFAQSFLYVYALIAGLIQVSGKDFPWIVDAPSSGLDPKNTRSLWEWMATLNRQVIVLPHPGELTVDMAKEIMGEKIAHQYELIPTEISQDASSKIRKVRN